MRNAFRFRDKGRLLVNLTLGFITAFVLLAFTLSPNTNEIKKAERIRSAAIFGQGSMDVAISPGRYTELEKLNISYKEDLEEVIVSEATAGRYVCKHFYQMSDVPNYIENRINNGYTIVHVVASNQGVLVISK